MENNKPRLFETAMALKAMMNLGYKHTDAAVAEIIDNSIEAGAQNIDVIVIQAPGGKTRSVWQVKTIAVLDEGCGIEPELLSRILSFGYGTHRDASRTPNADSFGKLGKFGVGLPNASISQAKDISVYSWQGGIENTYVSKLFVDKILSGDEESQHPAEPARIPNSLSSIFNSLGIKVSNSGTLVVWDRVTDRCNWAKGTTLVDKVEERVGRVFRKFIHSGKVKIRISVFNENKLDKSIVEPKFVRVNDPLFLMPNSIADSFRKEDDISIPEGESLFNRYPPESYTCFDLKVPYQNVNGEEDEAIVKIRFSKCRQELRQRVNKRYAGSTRVGQLTGRNQGVSILRAGRELELSQTWLTEDTRNRWIGAEIDFPPALDDCFGVSSTKQGASNLEDLAHKFNCDQILGEFNEQWKLGHPGEPNRKFIWEEMIELLRSEGDNRWVLYTVARRLSDNIKDIFRQLRKDKIEDEPPAAEPKEGPRTKGNEVPMGEKGGKEVNPVIRNTPGNQNPPKPLTPEEEEELSESAAGDPNAPNSSEEDKLEFARVLRFIKDNPEAKAVFANSRIGSNAFFDCTQEFDRVIIRFNKEHLAYTELFQQFGKVLDGAATQDESPELRFENADILKVSFLLMIYAWAWTETSLTEDDALVARSIRNEWGAKLYRLLKEFEKQRSL